MAKLQRICERKRPLTVPLCSLLFIQENTTRPQKLHQGLPESKTKADSISKFLTYDIPALNVTPHSNTDTWDSHNNTNHTETNITGHSDGAFTGFFFSFLKKIVKCARKQPDLRFLTNWLLDFSRNNARGGKGKIMCLTLGFVGRVIGVWVSRVCCGGNLSLFSFKCWWLL